MYRYALLRGEIDYAYSIVDKLIKYFEELEKRHCALVIGGLCSAGTERGKVKFKPLISEDITSFSLKNLRIAGKTYELTYSSGKFCVTEK